MIDHPSAAAQWPVGSLINFGRLDNRQPIQWVVLRSHGDYRLLLSTSYVAQRRIGKTSTARWEKSELRQWLNTEFIPDAFTLEEQNQLCQMNGDFVSLLTSDEIKSMTRLPDCIPKDNLPWWLCSWDTDSDNDTFFDYVHHTDTRTSVLSQRPSETAHVRPVIAISLKPSQATVDRTVFHYYFCPFCGTENANFEQPCTCCGFFPRRHYNMQHGQYSGTGCITALVSSLFLIPGLIVCIAGSSMGLLLIAPGLLVLFLGLVTRENDQRNLHTSRKYSNETDHFMPLDVCSNDEERSKALYHNASLLRKNAADASDYSHAANMYALLPGYEDADAQREACLKAADGCSPSSR